MTLSGFKIHSCHMYLDGVIVYTTFEEEHLHHMDRVLGLLRAAGLTLKLPKCR